MMKSLACGIGGLMTADVCGKAVVRFQAYN